MGQSKYIITETEKVIRGTKLYQIKAIDDFGSVHKGELGGFIEKSSNLSKHGLCWVGGNALVYGDAVVSEDAIVEGNARVYGQAQIYGDAVVKGNAQVCGTTKVYSTAHLTMAYRYSAGIIFDSPNNQPQYQVIEQFKLPEYDQTKDRKYSVGQNITANALTSEIVEMQEIIDEQAWEIEELKKKIPPTPSA